MTQSEKEATVRQSRPPLGVINRVFQVLLRLAEVQGPTAVRVTDENGTQHGSILLDSAGRLCAVDDGSDGAASAVPAADDADDADAIREEWRRGLADRICTVAERTLERQTRVVAEEAEPLPGDNVMSISSLALLLGITSSAVEWIEDHAVRLFGMWSGKAAAALLLVRPPRLGTVPLPLAERGFGTLPLTDLVPICKAAFEMAQSAKLVEAGHPPRLITRSAGDMLWAAASSSRRMVLLRLDVGGPKSPDRARLLSDAIRLIGEGEGAPS